MRARLLAVALLPALLAAGCFEEERQVTLVPGGAGTMHLLVRLRPDVCQQSIREGPERIERDAARGLGAWQGVAAWSDIQVGVVDSRVVIQGLAWFEDVGALARDGKPFVRLRHAGERTTLLLQGGLDDPGREPTYAQLLELPWAELGPAQERERRQSAQLLEGFRMELTVELPGVPIEADGFQVQDRMARLALEGVELRRELGAQLDYALELRQRLDTGELELAQARALLAERDRTLPHLRARTVTWIDPSPTDPARVEFQHRLDAARAAWESSPWRERLGGGRPKDS